MAEKLPDISATCRMLAESMKACGENIDKFSEALQKLPLEEELEAYDPGRQDK